MPYGDGTGPLGTGPLGGGRGPCARGGSLGRGGGLGRGMGRGRAGFGGAAGARFTGAPTGTDETQAIKDRVSELERRLGEAKGETK